MLACVPISSFISYCGGIIFNEFLIIFNGYEFDQEL